MKQPGETIARNLQTIREDRNLSLDQLSEMTGVSKSMLRQIEIGQSNPTIATIWKIANGLRIPFAALLREQTAAVTIGGFKESAPLADDTDHFRAFPLTAFDPERSFETYYVEIDPGTVIDSEAHQGNVEEHIFVIQGQMEIYVAGEEYLVRQEEFISFQADQPHRYQNSGEAITRAIKITSYLP